jgi:hypothetical protein
MSLLWLNGKKRCSGPCGEYKAPEEYHKDKSKKHGITSVCRQCFNARKRKFKSPDDRFWKTYCKKTRKVGECREWIGSCNKWGRPLVYYQGKRVFVRRLLYQLAIGPLSDEERVISTCNNHRCVRHSHLVKGTEDDAKRKRLNMIPVGDRNGARLHPESRPRGEGNGAAKLTEPEVRDIREMARKGMARREIATKFEVSPSTVRLVLCGETWKHVE